MKCCDKTTHKTAETYGQYDSSYRGRMEPIPIVYLTTLLSVLWESGLDYKWELHLLPNVF